jgi:hypothetical protein
VRALVDVTPATGEKPPADTAADLIRREFESLRQAGEERMHQFQAHGRGLA